MVYFRCSQYLQKCDALVYVSVSHPLSFVQLMKVFLFSLFVCVSAYKD